MTAELSHELFDEIRRLVTEKTNYPSSRIKPTTRLAHDLGIDGDDAFELLEEFGERYHVSFNDFVFLDYFCWEGYNPFFPIVMACLSLVSPRFRFVRHDAERREREITIAHLVQCAQAGHWIVPSETRPPPSPTGRIFRPAFILLYSSPILAPWVFFTVRALASANNAMDVVAIITIALAAIALIVSIGLVLSWAYLEQKYFRYSSAHE